MFVLDSDNYKIWSLTGSKNPAVVHALKLSRFPEIQFSGDEKVYARLANNAIIFAEVPDFHNTALKSPENLKIATFSLSPGSGPIHALCYIPCKTVEESLFVVVRLFLRENSKA